VNVTAPFAELLAFLREGLSADGESRLEEWLRQGGVGVGRGGGGGGGRPPPPVLLSGEGAEEVASAVLALAARAGVSVANVPWRWISPTGGGPPRVRPRLAVAVLFEGGQQADERLLELIARRSALLVAGAAPPTLHGSRLFVLNLPASRVEDLRLLASAGWPSAADHQEK
jgi:hypothetical protein